MAARKKAAKKKSVAKKGSSKALTTMDAWEREMAEAASTESARVKGGGGNYLSIKGGSFSFQGADLGEELDVVILDFVFCNEYGSEYDASDDTSSAPVCFAVGKDEDQLEAVENSPEKQSDYCAECEQNAWGSAERGRGKACANRRRIALLAASDLDKDPNDIEVAYLRTPPTSNRAFEKFWKGVAKIHRRPAYGVITTLAFDPDEDFPVLTFKVNDEMGDGGKINDANAMAIVMQKREECEDVLMQEPDFTMVAREEKPAKRGRKKAAKKKTGKKSRFSK